jgi:hypothetical protein
LQTTARIRTQVSAAHSKDALAFAIEKFAAVKAEFGVRAFDCRLLINPSACRPS